MFYTGGMLHTARADRPGEYRGTVIHVERSRFAPAEADLAALRAGVLDGYAFAAAYRNHLRRLWREDRELFHDLLDQAKLADVTLIDDWGDEVPSPRFVLEDVLRVLAMGLAGASPRRLYANRDDVRAGETAR